MHSLRWLLTPSSPCLPWETDGRAGKMDISISWGLGDSDGWLHLGIAVPQCSSCLWPLHVALSREHSLAGGLGGRLKSSFQSNTAGIHTQGAAWIHHRSHAVQGQGTNQRAPCSHLPCGAQDPRGGPFRLVLGVC